MLHLLLPLFAPLDAIVDIVQDATGLQTGHLRYLSCFFLAYPLGLIHRQIHSVFLRHFLAALWGFLMLVWMLGNGAYHSLISCTVAYIILFVSPNKTGARAVVAFAFLYMLGGHLYIQYTTYLTYSLDFTGSQMVITLKLCALAFNIQDGHSSDQVPAYQRAHALERVPTPLAYSGYMFFWCTALAGPFFEYRQYLSFIDRSLFEEAGGKVPAGSGKAAGRCIGLALSLMAMMVYVEPLFPVSALRDPEFIASTSFLYRVMYVVIVCFVTRCLYYTCWLLVEGANCVCGIGFNGYKGEGKDRITRWDGVRNVDVFALETSENLRAVVANWNMGTAKWLKHYCYERLVPPGARPTFKTTIITYAVSAVWHGFYPGYYHFFIGYAFFSNAAQVMRNRVRPLVLDTPIKPVYDLTGRVASILALDYLATSFILMANSYALVYFGGLYYCGHIICAVILLLNKAFPAKRAPRATTSKEADTKATDEKEKKSQ